MFAKFVVLWTLFGILGTLLGLRERERERERERKRERERERVSCLPLSGCSRLSSSVISVVN